MLKIRKTFQNGFTPLIDHPQHGIQLLRLGVLKLDANQTHHHSAEMERETALVFLSGTGTLTAGQSHWEGLGQRANVFAGTATAAYIPAGETWTLRAECACEVALITAPATPGPRVRPEVVLPEKVHVHEARGQDNFQRDVHDILFDQVPAQHLLIGETFNHPGNWSSYPPHKHDTHNPPDEIKLEEIYLYKINPKQGFGVQRVYTEDRTLDEVYVVENDDLVLLPRGYHPVAAAPGYTLYYLWVIAGEERRLSVHEDPLHAWVGQQS